MTRHLQLPTPNSIPVPIPNSFLQPQPQQSSDLLLRCPVALGAELLESLTRVRQTTLDLAFPTAIFLELKPPSALCALLPPPCPSVVVTDTMTRGSTKMKTCHPPLPVPAKKCGWLLVSSLAPRPPGYRHDSAPAHKPYPPSLTASLSHSAGPSTPQIHLQVWLSLLHRLANIPYSR